MAFPADIVFPDGIAAQGNGAVWLFPAVANLNAPKLSEVTAGIVVSCAISGFSPSGEQSSNPDPRYCSTQQYESPGRNAVTIEPIEYVYDPQNPDDDEMYAYYAELTEGRKMVLGNRLGLPFDQAAAVGQFLNLYTITCGAKNDVPIDPTSEGAKIKIRQKLFVSGPSKRDVAIVTG